MVLLSFHRDYRWVIAWCWRWWWPPTGRPCQHLASLSFRSRARPSSPWKRESRLCQPNWERRWIRWERRRETSDPATGKRDYEEYGGPRWYERWIALGAQSCILVWTRFSSPPSPPQCSTYSSHSTPLRRHWWSRTHPSLSDCRFCRPCPPGGAIWRIRDASGDFLWSDLLSNVWRFFLWKIWASPCGENKNGQEQVVNDFGCVCFVHMQQQEQKVYLIAQWRGVIFANWFWAFTFAPALIKPSIVLTARCRGLYWGCTFTTRDINISRHNNMGEKSPCCMLSV